MQLLKILSFHVRHVKREHIIKSQMRRKEKRFGVLSRGPAWRSVWEGVRGWVVIKEDFLEE